MFLPDLAPEPLHPPLKRAGGKRWLQRDLRVSLPMRNDSVTYYAHRSAPRMISCTGDRAPAREVLALRNI